jgi:pimeloyl-ACP methyl ester carboxylesterase
MQIALISRVLAIAWCFAAGCLPAMADDAPALCAPGTQAEPRVTQTTLAGVPAILRIPAHVTKPPVILWHGFGPPASEGAMMDALPLDDVAAVKVYLGLPLFGARAPSGGMKTLARLQSEDVGLQVFKPVVAGAANELPAVVASLEQHGCMTRGGTVRLVGFSAGGAAALYALSQGKVNIDAAVFINTSTGLSTSVQAYEQATRQTYTWSAASRELAQQTDASQHVANIARRRPALLFLQGTNDAVIDSHAAADVYGKLQPFYRGQESRLQLRQLPAMSHQWATDAPSLTSVRQAVGEWLAENAPAPLRHQ